MQDNETLTRRQQIVFLIIMIFIQCFQLGGVVLISILNKRFYELIGIYGSMVIGKVCFRKSWHSDSLLVCTLTTFIVYYFLTCGVLPTNVSVFCSVVLGYSLSFILYKCAIIKEQINSNVVVKNENGSIEVDLAKLSIEEIKELCRKKSFSNWDTDFLIEFFKNPNGLKKYEIAEKYRKDEKYMYRAVKSLIKKLNS